MSSDDIQQLIDQVGPGGVLKLAPARKEFQGPAVIRQPLTIEGQSCTLWSETGPVLCIASDGVVLKSLNIEVTGPEDQDGSAACALQVEHGHALALHQVAVRGNVLGLEKEEGEWRYPRSLRLGRLQSGHPHHFTAKLVVPSPCQFESEIAGLTVQPGSTQGGAVKLRLEIDPLSAGTILRGVITIRTASLTRTIHVNANAPVHATGAETVGSGQEVYVPADWQTLYVGDDDSTPAPAVAPPAVAPPAAKAPAVTPPARPAPAAAPPKTAASIPPPPAKQKPASRPGSTPQVTVPDRLESTPRPKPPATLPPLSFDPEPEPAPTKPPASEESVSPSSTTRERSQRRRPGMGSSLFGSTPVKPPATADPAASSRPSVVPPPPPRPASSIVPPAPTKPPSSVVPPAPSKPASSIVPPAPTKPPSSVVPPAPSKPVSSVVPPAPSKPPSSVVPPAPSSVVPPPPSKKPAATPTPPEPEAPPESTDGSKSTKRQKKSGLGGAFN
ncbi:right-handed parallel beta-helix repeat-containing protein [Lignipirellula cremea]|uniref:Filamentous hemagglutinin n=1 Tax=Lignipirellula cremea TaxID=2528010 RepID=A0A518DPT2_9BACT|nr:hypothetical protein [Lignipirellula cremea]QDU93852.1 hypothetical protein Pla8534_16360 [Lignipirellula cremea]